jgi:colicin import membrane protein
MSAMAPSGPANRDQKLFKAGVLALLVHVGFFIFMTFGLSWKTYPPEGIVVDLWSDLPQPEQPPIKKVKPLPPKKVKPLPPKKVKPLPSKKAKPLPPKPDIALKKEKEKKQKLAEEKKAKEKKAKEQKAKEKKEKEQKAKEKKEKEQKARVAAEVKRLQKEQIAEEERRMLQRKAAGAQAAKKRSLIDEYKAKILAKIKSRLILPPDLPNDPVAEFDVTLIPGGEILDVRLRKSSGFRSFDEAVERAIVLARPLPLPLDPALFSNFRNLSLKVHYND